ncbi:hypothetical protein GCM10009565_44040 [Amycolatopsis albidoflavus]
MFSERCWGGRTPVETDPAPGWTIAPRLRIIQQTVPQSVVAIPRTGSTAAHNHPDNPRCPATSPARWQAIPSWRILRQAALAVGELPTIVPPPPLIAEPDHCGQLPADSQQVWAATARRTKPGRRTQTPADSQQPIPSQPPRTEPVHGSQSRHSHPAPSRSTAANPPADSQHASPATADPPQNRATAINPWRTPSTSPHAVPPTRLPPRVAG